MSWSTIIPQLYASYEANVREKTQILQRLRLKGGKRALDIGCGTAPWAAATATLGYAATGVDIDPAMIELARQHHPAITLNEADFMTWVAPGRFDLIVAGGNQITYYPDHHAFLEKAAAHLAPGGTLLVAIRDFRLVREKRSDATLLAHTRHPDGKETIIVDYRTLVEGKKAACSFWGMTPGQGQWCYDYSAYLHSLSEIRTSLDMLGLAVGATMLQHETGFHYPIILARKSP